MTPGYPTSGAPLPRRVTQDGGPYLQSQSSHQFTHTAASSRHCVNKPIPTSLVGTDPKYPNRSGNSCITCGKWFLLPKDLRRHVRIHTGEKPYKCPVCPYRAAVKGNVKQHVVHTHNIPFDTNECTETYEIWTRSSIVFTSFYWNNR